MKSLLGIVIAALLALPVHAEEKMTQNIKRLTLETALSIAQAAIEDCRKRGVSVAVTVVDRGGHEQVVLRDVLAMDITLPLSKQKAHSAMAFNSPLSEMEGQFTGAYQVPKIDGLLIQPGGIPVNVGGNLMAGIGVAGAPSGEMDEECAKAGLEAVLSDLEMEE